MGAWGLKNFENDDAMDWLYELEKSKGLDVLLRPIVDINAQAGYLESPDCCIALAAVEIIKASLSSSLSNLPAEARHWVEKKQGLFGKRPQINKQHALLARQTVEKILDNSELKDLWQETDEFEQWNVIQTNLVNQLGNQ